MTCPGAVHDLLHFVHDLLKVVHDFTQVMHKIEQGNGYLDVTREVIPRFQHRNRLDPL